MRKVLLICMLVVVSVEIVAQNISGKVTDSRTGEPIAYANVYYEGMPVGVNTDADGNYTLPAIVGKTLVFHFFGYER